VCSHYEQSFKILDEMYLSCSSLVCPLETYPKITDVLRELKALGFQAFDLAAFEGWQNVDPSRLAGGGDAWSRAFVDAVAAAGMHVSSFNCGFSKPLNDPDPAAFAQCRREYLALLDLAEAVRCANLTVQPGNPIAGQAHSRTLYYAQGFGSGQAWDRSFDALLAHLSELAALAQGRGVTLGVEAHYGSLLEKPEDAQRMAQALWPEVGLTYDPSHLVMQGIPLPEAEALLAYTVHVHVRNASLHKMQETMADGIVDWAWLVGALRAHGYRGALAIEYFGGFDAGFENTRVLRDRLLALGVQLVPSQ
jgi:sugar phosphate isomerase/epimerase